MRLDIPEITHDTGRLLAVIVPMCVAPSARGPAAPTGQPAPEEAPQVRITADELATCLAWMRSTIAAGRYDEQFMHLSAAFSEALAVHLETCLMDYVGGTSSRPECSHGLWGWLLLPEVCDDNVTALRGLSDRAWTHAILCWVALSHCETYWQEWCIRQGRMAAGAAGTDNAVKSVAGAAPERLRIALRECWSQYESSKHEHSIDARRLINLYASMEVELASADAIRQLREQVGLRERLVSFPSVLGGADFCRVLGLRDDLFRIASKRSRAPHFRSASPSDAAWNVLRESLSSHAVAHMLRQLGRFEWALEAIGEYSDDEGRELFANVLLDLAERDLSAGLTEQALQRSLLAARRFRLNQRLEQVLLDVTFRYVWQLLKVDPPRYDEAITAAREVYSVTPNSRSVGRLLAMALRRKGENVHYRIDPLRPDRGLRLQSARLYLEAWQMDPDPDARSSTFAAVADAVEAHVSDPPTADADHGTSRDLLATLRTLANGPADQRRVADLDNQLRETVRESQQGASSREVSNSRNGAIGGRAGRNPDQLVAEIERQGRERTSQAVALRNDRLREARNLEHAARAALWEAMNRPLHFGMPYRATGEWIVRPGETVAPNHFIRLQAIAQEHRDAITGAAQQTIGQIQQQVAREIRQARAGEDAPPPTMQ